MKVRWDRIAILLGLWVLVGTILAVEIYFTIRVISPDITFYEVALPQYQRAAVWIVITPLVLWLRQRVPLSSGRWFGGVGFHFVASFLIMAAYYLARMAHVTLLEDLNREEVWTVAQQYFMGRNFIDMLYYWLVLAAGYGNELRQRYRQEELKAAQLESRLALSELQVLKSQLHPHFLFNTMNTISVLIREERSKEAVRLISELSTLLRVSLDQQRASEVTLAQEMDFLRSYVEIQEARFPDRLEYREDVSSEALAARIPNLILQPLVENAILHGIAGKADGGRVEVIGRLENGLLSVQVKDDGPGFRNAAQGGFVEGIGLSNTRERLKRMFGPRAGLFIQSEPGQGACVRLEIPSLP